MYNTLIWLYFIVQYKRMKIQYIYKKNREAKLQEATMKGSKNVMDRKSDIQTNTEYENWGPSNLKHECNTRLKQTNTKLFLEYTICFKTADIIQYLYQTVMNWYLECDTWNISSQLACSWEYRSKRSFYSFIY